MHMCSMAEDIHMCSMAEVTFCSRKNEKVVESV